MFPCAMSVSFQPCRCTGFDWDMRCPPPHLIATSQMALEGCEKIAGSGSFLRFRELAKRLVAVDDQRVESQEEVQIDIHKVQSGR